MKPAPRTRYSRLSWTVGLLVLAALVTLVGTLFTKGRGSRPAHPAKAAAPAATAQLEGPAAPQSSPPAAKGGHRVQGIVRLPGGAPAAGASVSVRVASTGWPEWRSERLDHAITGQEGAFVFDLRTRHDLLIAFEHAGYAGGLEELPPHRQTIELQLQPGFELGGIVTNDQGVPLGGVQVAVESAFADQRRQRPTTTTANGGYRFRNLPAGPVRLVARHDSWQPAIAPAIVGGDTSHVDLRFDRPSMGPLRGRVIGAVAQSPIPGATIELLPPGGRLGFSAPILAVTDAEGAFALAGLPRGTLSALVRHPEYGAVLRTVAIGASALDVTFELPPRSAVRGRLVAESGQPLPAGLALQIRDMAGDLDRAVVDAEGRFAFTAMLSPGSATVTVVDGAAAFQRSLAMSLAVRIQENAETHLELPVTAPATVKGKVVDERGRPVAGVTVQQTRLLAENARWLGFAAASLDIGSFGSQVADLVTYDRDQLLAVTRADGTFEFRGGKPGPLVARFDLPGRGSRRLRCTVPAAGTTADLGAIELGRGCRIAGRVLRGERGLAGAAVTVIGDDSQAMVVTRADGAFVADDLQPGSYRVRARLPSMPTGNAERDVVVPPDGAVLDVQLVLPPGRTVQGIVNGSDGQPVAGALVTVRGAAGRPTFTDPNGTFALELPERAVELQVSLGDRSRQRVVPVRMGQQQLAAIRIETPPVCTLAATLAGLPSKKRLTGGLLRLTKVEGGVAGETRTRWVEMQNGELRWPLAPAGRVRVAIWCEGYAPFEIERDFAANEVHSLGEVLLEPGSRLRGRVVDKNGEPVGNASVCLGDEPDLDLFEPQVRTGPDGAFTLTGVSGKSSTLVARAPAFAARSVVLRLPQDVLAAAPLAIVLEPGSTIEVLARPDVAYDSGLVQLRRDGRVLATAELDEDGRAVFHNRAAGAYTVQVFGSEDPPQPVVIEGAGALHRVQL